MNRLQIRSAVRRVLRDDGYPTEAINEALDRILNDLNNSGRYRFQQNVATVTLVSGTYKYAVTSTILGEHLVVFQVGVSADQKIILKGPDLTDAFAEGRFINSGNSPEIYIRWQDEWWFDPIPNSTANNKVVSIYHFKDLTLPASDYATIPIPTRYHNNLLVYGIVSEVAPALEVSTGEGRLPALQAYANAKKNFVTQETWERFQEKNLIRDIRWTGIESSGNVSSIR